MSTIAQYRGGNTLRGPSPRIWGDCPWDAIDQDPNIGYRFHDDFMSLPTKILPTTVGPFGKYNLFSSTGGTCADAGTQGGGVSIGSDGDDEGVVFGPGTAPFRISPTTGKFWWEARIKVSSIANSIFDVFVGLVEIATFTAAVPITATTGTTGSGQGVMSDNNLYGFLKPGGNISAGIGATMAPIYRANGVTAVAIQAAAVTLVADTFMKVGGVYDPQTNLLTNFASGVALSTTYTMATAAGTDFPNDVNLGLVFACINTVGSITPTATIDWWRAAQVFVTQP